MRRIYVAGLLLAFASLSWVAGASAEEPDWGVARDDGFAASHEPALWVPGHVLHGETVRIEVMNFPSSAAAARVYDPDGALVFEATLQLQLYRPLGYYGEVLWIVSRDIPLGDARVVVTTGDLKTEDVTRVHDAPHVFAAGPEPAEAGERAFLEAVGFDAAPVTADVVQGALRWEAEWPDGRGEDRVVGKAVNSLVPGAVGDAARRLLGVSDGDESVIVAFPVLAPHGAPVHVWFNGTVDGEPVSKEISWAPEFETVGARVWVPSERVYEDEPFLVFGIGFSGPVRLTLNEVEQTVDTEQGLFAVMVATPDGSAGLATLEIAGVDETGAAWAEERALSITARPDAVSRSQTPAASWWLVIAAVAFAAARWKRRA